MPRDALSFSRVGLAVGIVVTAVCLISPRPAGSLQDAVAPVALAGLGAWAVGLLLRPAFVRPRILLFAGYGASGALLDLLQPWGPGFVAGFMAVAAIALAMPLRPALLTSGPVLVLLAGAETATSDHPWNALLNILLGVGFFFGASSFAAAKRDATARVEQLLRQEEATRAAREEAAALEERARLARELHDVLAHTLSGLTLQLEAARLLAQRTNTDPRVLEQLDLAQKSARTGVKEGKRAIAALRGDPPADFAELPGLLAGFSRDTGIAATSQETGRPGPLTPEASLTLYRAAQEALSNIKKHAATSEAVSVDVEWSRERVTLTVRNVCPSGGGAPGFGFGLSGMAERAAALGGEMAAGRTVDGFSLTVSLPQDHAPARAT